MNRSAKDGRRSSPHYGDEGKLIQPIATRCVRAARSGRIEHDPRRTRRVVAQAAGHKRSDKSKAKRGVKHGEWSDCRIVPKKGGESRSTARRRQPGVGLGKATDKGRKKEPEGQKSKVKQEESSLREKPEPDWPRRLADWRNPEGARKVDSVVDKVTCSIPFLPYNRADAHHCESWMREICTSSLGGGRRSAPQGAPPPTRQRGSG
jgi:hypothetical protein